MRNVISNTSCLIVLDNLNLLWVLKELYGTVRITAEVCKEFGGKIDEWLIVREVQDKKCVKTLNAFIDIGEASSIALALESDQPLLVLDDLKARNIALKLGLKITGTLGVLVKAKQRNLISSVREALHEMKRLDFRITRLLARVSYLKFTTMHNHL